MNKILECCFRGFYKTLAMFVFTIVVTATLLGPAILTSERHNAWFLALYLPHMLVLFYCLGSPDEPGVSGPENVL